MFSWRFAHGEKWHPLYPLLIQALSKFIDPIFAGRLLSLLFGGFSLYFLWRLTQKLYGRAAAFWASLFFVVSPLLLWVQLRVLTESLFVFTSLATIFYFLEIWKKQYDWNFCLLVFFCGLGALTRPEGLLGILLIAAAFIRLARGRTWKPLLYAAPAVVPWALLLVWFHLHTSGSGYQNVAAISYRQISIQKLLIYFVSYLEAYPYVMFYPVFLFALYHLIFKAWKSNRIWFVSLFAVHALWFGILAFHWAWTTRLLVLPATLLLVEAGSMVVFLRERISRRVWNTIFLTVFLFSWSFAVVALYFQRETFADFKESTLFIREHRKNQRVYSDELIKVGYYLQSPVLEYSRDAHFQPGDIIALHSFHTTLREELVQLSRQYQVAFVYGATARTIPILANGLAATMTETNQVSMLQRRFEWQKSSSVVLQVLSQKQQDKAQK